MARSAEDIDPETEALLEGQRIAKGPRWLLDLLWQNEPEESRT